MPVDGLQFMKGVGASPLQPVYYLCGNSFLVERCLDRLIGVALPSRKEAALEIYRSDTPPERIIDSALTFPFFSERKVIVVKEVHLFSPSELEEFIPYIERPSPRTLLLFVGETVDRRKRFYQVLEGKGVVVEFGPLRGRDLVRWIGRMGRELGLEMTLPAIELLVEMVGEDLGALSKEIEKLRGFFKGRSRVDVEDIRFLTASTRPWKVFDLIDSVRRRDTAGSLKILERLMDEGESATGIIALLARYFRILWMLKHNPSEEVGRRFRIPGGLLQRYQREGKGLTEEDLSMAYQALFHAEKGLKTSQLPEKEVLRDLILKLTFKGNGDSRSGKKGVYPLGKP